MRPLLALTLLAPAAFAAVALGGDQNGAALLPDLDQRPPAGLQVTRAGGRERPRFRLGFTSAVENVGRGPLEIEGRRRRRSSRTMTVDQVVTLERGYRRNGGVARLRYVRSPDHAHWHYLRFERYELRRAGDFVRVRRDRKTGFCLGDRYESEHEHPLPGEPRRPVWTGECGKSRPRLLRLEQGISVGYGDDYPARLEGQYLDVTGLAAGRYQLVHRVNADRRLEESDHSNNTAAALFELSWPHGPRRAPAIRALATCETERCGRGRDG